MISYPLGTKVWYRPLMGGRIATEVQGHRTHKGVEYMEVYLPDDPGVCLTRSDKLEIREE